MAGRSLPELFFITIAHLTAAHIQTACTTMAEPRIRLVFLWHMHQPFYKDLVRGVYRLPWTRLHALKDYYGMVAILDEFPRIHQTFNLVPSLLAQLDDYAHGTARETVHEIACKPTQELTKEDRLYMLRYFFQANLDHVISRYPRYRELFDRMHANDFEPERALPFFQPSDFADLQVLSQLAWVDEEYLAKDPQLRALAAKAQGYDRTDQQLLERKQAELIRAIFTKYRETAERGQIEISTSPFYHPILPLLCDTETAAQARPGVRLPQQRFRHPEDARLQLERAVALHRQLFGHAPRGFWPSEGSVSEDVLRIAASCGFDWSATDQRVLGNSTDFWFHRDGSGVMVGADRLYRPYFFATDSGPVRMLFRDQELSDRIGFVYSRMEAQEAAADFIRRVKQGVGHLGRHGNIPTVSVILDGENAWEYFPQNGRLFLRTLYEMLSGDPNIECVTVSEALERAGPGEPLTRLAPGSWINGNFDIWLGAEEDNQAWDFLSRTRDFFAEHEQKVDPSQRATALEELLVAEGSDWNWWYGPEHSTANDADFDELYRSHLSNVYQSLGHPAPEELRHPITRVTVGVASRSPEGTLAPRLDGVITNYFEWMAAGFYRPVHRQGAMHGRRTVLSQVFFGRDAEYIYLRVDFHNLGAENPERLEVRVTQRGSAAPICVRFRPGDKSRSWRCEVQREGRRRDGALGDAVLEKILELRLSQAALEVHRNQALEFQISLWEDGIPVETLPLEGWINVPPTS
jgi:alpha-amylase/alpha-mannosidase (GH57 family)